MNDELFPSVVRELSGVLPRRRGLRIAVWILALAGLWPHLAEIGVRVEQDPNEGWNAVWADRIAAGQPIYFGPDSLLANNYPPLSFHLLALFPDPLIAGRWVALGGLLATAAAVGWLAWRTGGDGITAAGLLVAFVAAHHSSYVAMDDPEWLARAVMTGGLVALVAGDGRGTGLMAGAALMLTAGFMKHSLLPLPLAVTGWIWREGGRERWRWLAAAASSAAVGFAWMGWQHGAQSFANIFEGARGYSAAVGLRSLLRWSLAGAPLLIVAAAGLVGSGNRRWRRLAATYLIVALLWAAALIGGDAVDRNVFFDLVIASVWAAGWSLARVERSSWGWWVACALVPVAVGIGPRWAEPARLQAHAAAWANDIAWLKTQSGIVGAERMALVHWSGHPVAVENFLLTERLQSGRLDPKRIAEANIRIWQLPLNRDWPLPAGPLRDRWLSGYKLIRATEDRLFYVRRAP